MLRCQTNGDHHALQVFQDVIVGEPEHAVSTRSKPLVAAFIVTNSLIEIVALAIDLYDQPARMRDEVRDVISRRALPPKPERGEPMRF